MCNSVLKSTVDSLSVVVSVGDQHSLLVTVSGGQAPSQAVLVGIEAEMTPIASTLFTVI